MPRQNKQSKKTITVDKATKQAPLNVKKLKIKASSILKKPGKIEDGGNGGLGTTAD